MLPWWHSHEKLGQDRLVAIAPRSGAPPDKDSVNTLNATSWCIFGQSICNRLKQRNAFVCGLLYAQGQIWTSDLFVSSKWCVGNFVASENTVLPVCKQKMSRQILWQKQYCSACKLVQEELWLVKYPWLNFCMRKMKSDSVTCFSTCVRYVTLRSRQYHLVSGFADLSTRSKKLSSEQ